MSLTDQEICIRRAQPGDEPGMAALEKICFAVPWKEEDFIHEIRENRLAIYVVAECCSEIIGCAGVWRVLDEGHITNVSVSPEFRRQGIAKKIIEEIICIAEAEGVSRFTLEVRPSNEAALSLYSGFGFREAGRRKGYYSDNGEDAIIMWR